jgi:hypothetical protein
MYDLQNSKHDDEIDLRELFIALWAYKLLIMSTCVLGIVLGSYYLQNTEKTYNSTAIFKLDHGENTGGKLLNGELGALASLAGFGGSSSNTTFPKDQINGRIFIEELDIKLNFKLDSYFNTYDPNSVEPIWKSLIKRAIGWQKSSIDIQEVIWQGIVKTYSENVFLDETLDGSAKIVVTHTDARRAAEIANVIMDEIISRSKNKRNDEQDKQLSYLSNTLAKALFDLEISQSNLKEFALENSALPLENFAAGSLQLDALREQLSRTSELHDAVAALSTMLKNKATDQTNYLELRQQFPIVDQVEFRRVLGQNEIISSWTWPEASSVKAVFDTLSERKSRLQAQINASQIDAERSGLALETYAKLEREAKIAQATYTVLIEQVKAQSMAAGYRPDKTEIYEYASASIIPSKPKRSLVLALGAIIGLFSGSALSLMFAVRRGVFYSKDSLKKKVQAHFMASGKALLPFRNKSLDNVKSELSKKLQPVLRDMAVEIHKSSAMQVVITSSRARLTGNDVSRALASYMQSDSTDIAVIDFSLRGKKLDIDDERLSIGSFLVSENLGHVSVLRPDSELAVMEMLSQKDFWKSIQSLKSTFNLVFLCADNSDAISLLNALEGQKTFHITLARTKNTKSATLMHMRSLLPIQGLLYD